MSFLNQEKGLLFVHIYKNAGMSVSQALRSVYGNDLTYSSPRITGIERIDRRLDYRLIRSNKYVSVPMKPGLDRLIALEVLYSGHITVKTFEENISFSNLESFAIVRNPWSWQVSLFNFARSQPKHFHHGDLVYTDFDTYIRWRCDNNFSTQAHFLESHRGGIGVKNLLRFESLSHDWNELSIKTGLKLPDLRHTNQSTYDDWKTYYTDETAALVANTFEKDCRQFGYSFDS